MPDTQPIPLQIPGRTRKRKKRLIPPAQKAPKRLAKQAMP